MAHQGQGGEDGDETDLAALSAWVDRFGPCPSAPHTAGRGQDAQARRLREAIHQLVTVARGPAGPGAAPAAARERGSALRDRNTGAGHEVEEG